MTARGTAFRSSKSIAGAAFVGLGMFILYGNLAGAVAQLRHVLDANGSEALGVLPAVILATSQGVHACAFDHQGVLQCLLRMLISFWPPLLVIVGTMLLRDAFTDKVKAALTPDQHFQKNTFQNKNTGCRFRCPSFDV
jgi:hypothetical protein